MKKKAVSLFGAFQERSGVADPVGGFESRGSSDRSTRCFFFSYVSGVVSLATISILVPAPAAAQLGRQSPRPVQDHYVGAQSLRVQRTAPDARGRSTRVRLLKTSGKYSLVQVVDRMERDPETGEERVVSQEATVGDHVVVKLHREARREDFEALVKTLGARVRKAMPLSGVYLVSFDASAPESLDRLLRELGNSPLVQIAEPDSIARVR